MPYILTYIPRFSLALALAHSLALALTLALAVILARRQHVPLPWSPL